MNSNHRDEAASALLAAFKKRFGRKPTRLGDADWIVGYMDGFEDGRRTSASTEQVYCEDAQQCLATVEQSLAAAEHGKQDHCDEQEQATEAPENLLRKAELALASAYQAAGVLVFQEPDRVPSEKDQTDFLDLLSRWETMSEEQIEAFLPWPKDWELLNSFKLKS